MVCTTGCGWALRGTIGNGWGAAWLCSLRYVWCGSLHGLVSGIPVARFIVPIYLYRVHTDVGHAHPDNVHTQYVHAQTQVGHAALRVHCTSTRRRHMGTCRQRAGIRRLSVTSKEQQPSSHLLSKPQRGISGGGQARACPLIEIFCGRGQARACPHRRIVGGE